MKATLINQWGVQIDSKTNDYKTLEGARKAYTAAKKDFTSGEIVSLIQYTDVINYVETIECNM